MQHFFRAYRDLSKHKKRGGPFGEFETVMHTRDVVESLHNFENSPSPPSVKMRLYSWVALSRNRKLN